MVGTPELWRIDLWKPTKAKMAAYQKALQDFGGVELDRCVMRSFTGKQAWRNPIAILIRLPAGARYRFIAQSRIWLYPREKFVLGIPEPTCPKLQGKHDGLKIRRSYNLHFGTKPWIKDYTADGSYRLHEGEEILNRVLNGDLEVLTQKT